MKKKNYRKLAVTTIAAATAATAIVPVASIAAENSYTDLEPGDSHYDRIMDLTEQGVVKGLPDGSFGVNTHVTRAQVAVMLTKALDLDIPGDLNAVLDQYTDVNENTLHAKYIAAVTEADIFKGSGEEFNPGENITRQQMASVLVKGLNLEAINTDEDVDMDLEGALPSHINRVQILGNLGITKALEDFRPGDSLTRGQFATFLSKTQDVVDGVEAPDADLEVESVSAIDATSAEVTLKNPVEGLTKDDFVLLVNGEAFTVTNASANNDNTVYTLTHNSLAGQEGTFSVNGVEVAFDYSEDATDIEIVTAKSTSNTEVIVELADAPLKNLKASDFIITPNLPISSVTTNDNVITLKTVGQSAGQTYTITPALGSGSAEFEGKAAVEGTGVIQTVDVQNLRQLKVEFNQPVLFGSVNTFDKFYFDVAAEKDGNIVTNRLDTIANTTDWEIVSEDATATDMVDYVIIQSSPSGNMSASEVLTDLGLNMNENVKLDVRNAEDGNGAYYHSSQGDFMLVDNNGPEIKEINDEAEINKLFKDEGVSFLDRTIAADQAYLVVEFDEAVQDKGSDASENEGFEFYINGVKLNNQHIITPDNGIDGTGTPSGTDNYVRTNGTVKEHSTVIIDVTHLSKDEKHILDVVGARDLNDNVQPMNKFTKTFEVVAERIEAPSQDQFEKAKVFSVTQTSDNALEIIFDQPGVEGFDSTAEHIILHEAAWDGNKWDDLVVDMDADTLNASAGDITVDKDLAYNLGKQSRYTISYAAVNDKANGNTETFNYDNQDIVFRDVTVKDFVVAGVNAHPTWTTDQKKFYRGAERSETQKFTKDKDAPKLAGKSFDIDNAILNVTFSDGPHGAPIALVDGKEFTVRITDGDTITEQQTYTIGTGAANIGLGLAYSVADPTVPNANAVDTVVIDLDTLGATDLLDGQALYEGDSVVYTVTFEQGAVVDAESDITWTSNNAALFDPTGPTPAYGVYDKGNEDRIILDGPNESAETAVSIPVKDGVTTPTPGEGIVPQTTKGLIQSGTDVASNGPIAMTETGDATQVGNEDWMVLPNNLNKIIVVFDGDVQESSAVNKKNYTYNGQPLPEGAKISYYSDNINANVGFSGDTTVVGEDEGFVIIELPEGSITRDGTYTFSAMNVTNKSGKRMLPVTTSIQLVDNTKPSMLNVKSIGDKQVEVRFDESVTTTDAAKAVKNFTVKVNGHPITVSTVTPVQGDDTRLVLTLVDHYDVSGTIEVEVHNNNNGNMYVTDKASPANKAREMTK